jgi:sugar-specific transcriptional regulator TrmB
MVLPSEDPVRVIDSLKSLGLTKYEALVYIALLKVASATASTIHEISGVPRASVYTVMNQLLNKGLVSVSQSAPKRFAAFPPEDAIARLMGYIEKDAQYSRDSLSSIYRERTGQRTGYEELIWNIYGIENIKKRLVHLITAAKHEIRIIAHPRILSPDVRQNLITMANRVSIEIITPYWAEDSPVPEKLQVYVIKYPDLPKEMDTSKDMMAGGVCIIDGKSVLVFMGLDEVDAVALFSDSEGFIRFFVRFYNLILDWAKKSGDRRNL